jgi:hypothetical protein
MSIPFYAVALPILLLLTAIAILRRGLYSDETKFSASMVTMYALTELTTNGYSGLLQSVLVLGLLLSICASTYMLYRAAGGGKRVER